MNIDLSSFRQEVSKIRLSEAAFNDLLNAKNTSQGHSELLNEELRYIRNLIDHESHVLILDGLKRITWKISNR